MAELPAGLSFGTVTGRLIGLIADRDLDEDTLPDAVELNGTVVFTPSIKRALVTTDSQPTTIFMTPIEAYFDGEGYLFVGGNRSVQLLATNAEGLNPTDFTYEVSFVGLTVNQNAVSAKPFHIRVPAGETIDITIESPVESSAGNAIVRGPTGMSTYELWKSQGNEGTLDEFIGLQKGETGDSAYQAWLDTGNTGTPEDFIASIKGAKGDPYDPGPGKQVVVADQLTGKVLTDLVEAYLATRFVSVNQLVVNVYDHGAIDVSKADVSTAENLAKVPSSQAAIDRAIAKAESMASATAETRVWVQIPYGAIRGAIHIKSSYVSVLGPGALVSAAGLEGEVLFEAPNVNQLLRFHSTVRDLTLKPLNAALFRGTCGVRVRGAAFVSIQGIRVRDIPVGVMFDTWEGLAGQQNKNVTIGGVQNEFINVDYSTRTNQRPGTTWDATADSRFVGNICRNSYISHGLIEGADGFWTTHNQFFMVGRDSTDTYHKGMKSHGWVFGPRTAFAFFTHNEVFETGLAGLYLNQCTGVTVVHNNFGWCGQLKQVPTILVETSSTLLTGAITIDLNAIDTCTGHGIGVIGTGNAGNILIPGGNNIRLMGDEERNVYRGDKFGGDPLRTNDLAQIYVAPTVIGLPQLTHTQKPRGSRKSVIDLKGMRSSARRTPHIDQVETVINLTKTFVAGAGQPLCVLASTSDPVSLSKFVGSVEVSVKSVGDAEVFVARYEFTAASNNTNKTVANVRMSGSTSSITGGRTPAFTFTIPNSNGMLNAAPVGETAGMFEFTIKVTGMAQASYTDADFAALPLMSVISGT